MSEARDKVQNVTELPMFPLSVVLFPGVPLPLHIFEPRYRKMIDDIGASNKLFGVAYFDANAFDTDRPPIGHVGSVAEVTEVQKLPDGRSNILTLGVIRYKIEEYLDRDEPYLVARVSFFEDDFEDQSLLTDATRDVADTFTRIAQAVRTINDERSVMPDITNTEPEHLSFLVSAAMEVEAEVKQELLELRSTSERLQRLRAMLNKVVKSYEERARVHELAKGNGHSGRKIEIE